MAGSLTVDFIAYANGVQQQQALMCASLGNISRCVCVCVFG